MRYMMICIMMLAILNVVASQKLEYEPITADNIDRLQQVAEINFRNPGDQVFYLFERLNNAIVMVKTSDDEYLLYDLASGDRLRAFTPGASEDWYDGFEDLIPSETIQRTLMLETAVAPPFESGYNLTLVHSFSPDSMRLVSFISTLWLANPEERGTLIEVIGPDGTRLNRIEYPYIVNRILWSSDSSHFIAYASGELPGQTPGMFTADGTLIGMLDHGFPIEEELLGVEHVHWLDDTRILSVVGYRQTFIHAAYIWDATTAERIVTILPDDGDNWRFAVATDYSRFVMWKRETVRVVDAQGATLGEFPNDGYADVTFVNHNMALLGWHGRARPFSVLGLDGALLGESHRPMIDLGDTIYEDYRRAFTPDRTLMVASPGDDCLEKSPSLYLWSLEDPGTPLAEMPYNGYVYKPVFLANLIYVMMGFRPGYLRDCDYEMVEEQLVFWNFNGERVLEFPLPNSITVVDNLLVLRYSDRIEVWGVSS